MSDLINRLRETASKGVSVWGDLQVEAAKEIEILTAEREAYASAMDRMTKEVEALQAQIAEQDHELADTAFLAGQYKAERDAALAKLQELESQPSPTARTYMDGYADGKQWALEEAAKVALNDIGLTTVTTADRIRRLKEGL